ncbi:hypothetical protein PY092_14405 [Muricauda sp. 334s03]|uniref:Uncharacterized protein n=1 Tax=Flagellimonas yonaguniensis TaxID=3031325 RepID=A0ABT5Y1M7_9FLAO|nr:hypothetical protein [[Muricauda] yonaguniensis]MDF0717352.1 hypothetical protein [[Muricauda] yonaguniensis]
MGLAILSKKAEEFNETLNNVVLTIINARLNLCIQDNAVNDDGRIEIEIAKKYINDEYLSMDIITKREQIEQNHPDLLEILFKNQNYFMIAGTADADCEHLIYDFSLSYLRLQPDHIICIYDEAFITAEGIKKIESKKGFYSGWMKKFMG